MRRIFFLCFSMIALLKSYGQVNLQTGSAVFSLPMFNWEDDKSRLTSVVALSYNSGNGLKVSDVASNVGQGWNLLAGGVINRIQEGEPDDQEAYGSAAESDITKYPSGILYGTVPIVNGCPDALTRYPLYGSQNQLYAQHNIIAEDKQLDYFTFEFNGKSGMFILDPTNIGTAQFIGDTKMIVTYTQDANHTSSGIRTKISSFTIQDVDGVIYRFAKLGLSKTMQVNFCDPTFTQIRTQPKFHGDHVYYQNSFDVVTVNPWVVSSWYLTEIEDALTHRKVLFNYGAASTDINTYAGEEISYNSDKNYSVVAHKQSITKTPDISSISFPDGHNVSFVYGANRFDMNGEKALSYVDISYSGRPLSRYLLTTSYFIKNRFGTPTTNYQKAIARLCLMSVQKIGVDLKEDSPAYIFDYYVGSNSADDFVPPAYFYAKDIWGYYNGDKNKGFNNENIDLIYTSGASISAQTNGNSKMMGLCYLNTGNTSGHAVLNPKAGYAKNGLLRQVVYPTGGTLTYDYAQNTGVLPGTSTTIDVGGVHVATTSSTDGGNSNGCNTAITTQYSYITSTGTSSLWGIETPLNAMTTNNHYQPEYKDYHWSFSTGIFGECFWHFRYPGILSQFQAMNLSTFQHIMDVLSPILGVISAVTTVLDIITVATGGNPLALIIDVIVGLADVLITCIGDQSRDKTVKMYYSGDLNGVSPLPMQFKRVEVTELPAGNGKTVQEFTDDSYYALWLGPDLNTKLTPKQRFAPWAYGLPAKTTVYDAAGNKVKESENTYDFSRAQKYIDPCNGHPGLQCNPSGIESNIVCVKCLVTRSQSQRVTNWVDPNQYNSSYSMGDGSDMKVDFYGIYTGRVELTTARERMYKPSDPTGQYAETSTNYFYNIVGNYEPSTISTGQSNGDVYYKYIKYTTDYTGGAITTLLQNNIVALPVATSTAIYRSLSYKYTGEKVTEFTQLANGDIKPSRTLEQRFAQPLLSSSFTPYAGPGGSIANYKIPETFSYDANANLIGVKDEGNRSVANIYGYNDKYVIASIINADLIVDHCAYAGFEDGTLWAGWSLNITSGVPTYTSSAVTGVKGFVLTPYTSFITQANAAKAYTLSFWASNSSVPVSTTGGSATLIKSAPTINGFTYYEYDIAAGASYVTVGGTNANIDELRFYPKNARMTSECYDPLIGKISECDVNNRVTYYEYDNLGRLRFIKDDNRNILKMYEYNNVSASKQNGCPGIYYNHYISETITRSNCGAGYMGGPVTYTVGANSYSSTISQADADAQAETYLLTNGQTYANSTGSCSLIYYNTYHYQAFTTQNCPEGYAGGTVAYTVPAGRYSSIISQQDAEDQAQEEIDANGQAYANDPVHAICNVDTHPHWVSPDGNPTNCQCVDGQMHLFRFATDINPNSSTYNQTSWQDSGPDASCGSCTTVTLNIQNNVSCSFYVYLTNTVTNEQYYTTINASSSLGIDVPAGTYDISLFIASGDCTSSYSLIYTLTTDAIYYDFSGAFYAQPLSNSYSNNVAIDYNY